jgi:hypothetical protein
MGLDQYGYIKLSSISQELTQEEDFKELQNCNFDFAYWRKHPNLQGWMERKWREKNNTSNQYQNDTFIDDEFNCVELELTLEDIDELEEAVKNENLNGGHGDTTGFFFGNNADDAYYVDDLKFCRMARLALSYNIPVYYNSSW